MNRFLRSRQTIVMYFSIFFMLNPRFSAGQDKFGTCSLQIRSMFVSMETNMKRRRKVFGAYLMYVFFRKQQGTIAANQSFCVFS